jgi:hypothetical protein
MPVKMCLTLRSQLRIQENKCLDLPAIQIFATNRNIIHIYRITCSVTGTPEEHPGN